MKKALLTFVSLFILILAFCFSALAVENYTFDTVDGDTASIYSDSYEVTVNVFGRPTCGNTEGTILDILKEEVDETEGVKINFIDIDMNTKETVLGFRNNETFRYFPDNSISFCYCNNSLANNLLWSLLEESGNTLTSITLPVIAFIRNNGELIKVTTGLQKASTISEIIKNKDTITNPSDNNNTSDAEISFSVNGTANYDYAFEVLKKLNELRASKGLSPLTMDKELLDVAMQRAAEISVYYSHTRPDGSRCFTAYKKASGGLGENIALAQKSPSEVMEAWTNSSGHYQNMVNNNYHSAGIGAFKANDGTLCWVQFFSYGKAETPVEKSGEEEKDFQITATYNLLRLSAEFYHYTDPALLKKGDTATLRLLNTNSTWSYMYQRLSFSDFELKSENEALLYIDENGDTTVTGDPPFTVNVRIISKSNPELYSVSTITIGHEHKYSVRSSTNELCCGYTEAKKTYYCYYCDYSYSETETSGSHSFKETVLSPATVDSDGKYGMKCACGETKDIKAIPKITDITLSETEYTYNGKNQKPTLTIKDKSGYVLKEGTDYFVNGTDDLMYAGIHKITVYFQGKYSGFNNSEIKIYPASPSKLTLKSTAKTVTAKWKNAKGADSYKVELLRNGKAYKTVTTSATTVKFEKLSKNTKYTVRVTALSAYDSLSSLKSISSDTATVSAPVLKVKAQKKKASLSWDKVKNASGYVIYMATAKNGKYKKVATVKGGTLKYTKKKLKTNKKYYFKIKAYRTIGKKNIYSSYSSVKSVKIK